MYFSRKLSAIAIAAVLMAGCALPAAAAGRKVERRISPVYPELARRMHIGGTVRVATTIAADGKVTHAKAMSGNRLLETAAENAVRQWRFEPSTGSSTENIDIDFVQND